MNIADTDKLKQEFYACQKTLTAFGDEVRQRLLLLMVMEDRNGVRVADISEKMELTRPAVSHHMQILKDAGIVQCRKEGKCVYYYFDPNGKKIDALLELFEDVKRILQDDDEHALQ